MSDENPTQRKRGRPRKDAEATSTASVPTATEAPTVPHLSVEDENMVMQEQIKYQMWQLMKMAERQGINFNDLYGTPSSKTTIEEVPEQEEVQNTGDLPGGSVLSKGPNAAWVPFTRRDLEKQEKITFIPQPIPGLVFPARDAEGNQKIKLDIQDLTCWLTVGTENTVSKMFYDAYMDSLQQWRELENFKRNGPGIAPWGQTYMGRKAWHFDPNPSTFGMDEDGRFLGARESWNMGLVQPEAMPEATPEASSE